MRDNSQGVVFLMGPTATGKTDLALALAERFPCDVVSVDSALVYRGMDIGTAKPDRSVRQRVPHRLIDICDPAESYSAAEFRRDALREIEKSHAAGRIPLLVGGTMLYFRALRHGLSDLPSADPEVRARLEAQARHMGWAAMHERLARIDPETAARVHPNDPQRIQRALEVYELTGQVLSKLQARRGEAFPYPLLSLVVAPEERVWLHRRIEHRFEVMLQEGLVEEVERLYRRGDLHSGLPSIRAVGYRQVWDYLDGNLSYAEMQQRAVTATRQLAKRQLTWLRREGDASWFRCDSSKLTAEVLKFVARSPI